MEAATARDRDLVIAFAAGMRGQIPALPAALPASRANVEAMGQALKAVGLTARPISPEAVAALKRQSMKES